MISASARLLATLTGSHQITTAVDVRYAGASLGTLYPISGEITLDKTAQVRRTGRLRFAGRTADVSVLLTIGVELVVSTGVSYGGTPELLQVGVFRVEDAEIETVGTSSTVDVTMADRSASVRDARFTAPVSVTAGTNYQTAIQSVLSPGLPLGAGLNISATAFTTPALAYNEEGDRWAAASDMAASYGQRLVFNALGNAETQQELNSLAGSAVAWDFDANPSTLAEMRTSVSRNSPKVYNGAVVIGADASGTPVRGTAYDTDAGSPTYWGGPFGSVPVFSRSTLVTTSVQATAAAVALLARSRRVVSRAHIQCPPLPHLEDGDVVVARGQRYQVLSATLPLVPGPMTLECTL